MDEFQELLTTHQSLQKRLAEQPLSVDVEEVKSFVLKVRESGARIRDYQQRDQLRTILRLWGAFVYERVGQYPATQLASYDRPLGPISDVITQVGAGPGWLPWVLLALMVVVLGGGIALIYFRPPPMTQGTSSTATALSVAVSSQVPSAMPQQESSTPPVLIATIVVENATLRSAPDATGAVIGLVPRGLKLTVLARSADSAWLKVKAADETVGWITPGEIGLSGRQVAQVPQGVIAPVTPTATPLPKPAGPTPTVTPTPQPTALYVVRVLDSQPVHDSGALRIREARNTEALLVDSAAVGEPLTVYQRVTEGNTTWLWVESPRGKRGWVRENQDGTLLVARPEEVTPTPANTLTPRPSATPTSTRTPAETPIAALRPTPTALAVNVLAKVTPPEGAKLKVRDKPSVAGAVLGELDQGAQVAILEGPTRADGLVWWRVDNGERLVGWSAEGVGDVQYLAPVGWAR